MAITYAWRLDANKYAYLIDPTTDEGEEIEYGYLTDYPLTGENLDKIAQITNARFGEGGTEGFSGYISAFNAMKDKIRQKEEWQNAEYYDLLSADVYYSVDSANCVDLRGVGIKGLRFLGTATPDETFDINNPSYNPNGKVTDTNVLLVYGVYMDDQNDDPTKGDTPESFFVVKNGANGEDYESGIDLGQLEEELKTEIHELNNHDNELSDKLEQLEQRVDAIDTIDNGDVQGFKNDIDSIKSSILDLSNKLDEALRKIAELEDYVNRNNNNDDTDGGSVNWGEVDNETAYKIVVTDGMGNFYQAEDVSLQNDAIYSKNGFYEEEE